MNLPTKLAGAETASFLIQAILYFQVACPSLYKPTTTLQALSCLALCDFSGWLSRALRNLGGVISCTYTKIKHLRMMLGCALVIIYIIPRVFYFAKNLCLERTLKKYFLIL